LALFVRTDYIGNLHIFSWVMSAFYWLLNIESKSVIGILIKPHVMSQSCFYREILYS